jgi:aromatic-L-amino-acid/L-tryptophan decarboxylase
MNPLEISCEEFRHLAEQVTALAEEYLRTLDARPIFPLTSGAETESLFHAALRQAGSEPSLSQAEVTADLPENGMGEHALRSLEQVLRHSRAQNGRFFGYVLGSGEPVGAIADLLASVLNPNVTAWRSAPAAVTIERAVVEWLATAIGCASFSGSLTGGGSTANLMGLTMAREAKAPANEGGLSSSPRCVVYASEQVHMSIPKAVALVGIGRQNLRLIPTDESFRMIPEALDQAIRGDRRSGRIPVAVVASAGTVNTGAIDPLAEIAEIARRHGTWFHVDGAYGALAALTVPEKFKGIELANSVSLDPHKWLYQPLDCGCVLFRDPATARTAFAHSGEYAKSLSSDPIEGFAFFEESLELSRRFRALKVWVSLRYHGVAAFRAAMRKDLEHAQRLAKAVESEPKLELMAPVELSAVCFRYRGEGLVEDEELNAFNAEILQRLVRRGRVYLSNASLRGRFCLRACILNHRTTDADVDTIIPEVLATAAELRRQKQ